jgi:DNA-directed RNA polymerase specialized sigma24 family protein
MAHAVRDEVSPEQIAALAPGLRRYAAARHVEVAAVDDLVQETIARLLEVRTRLDLATLFAYALAVLTNLDRSRRRGDDVARRHRHRLLDLDGPASADDEVIRGEQLEALRRALDALAPDVQQLLVAHYAPAADPTTSTSGAQAARLARARAKLRLEYLLALRHVTLPEQRCRAVLVAISERNTRRQTELGAGSHITTCPTCMSLADPLLRRDSRLFGLWPLLAAAVLLRKAAGAHPVVAASAGVVTAGVVTAAVVLALPSPHHRPAPPRPSALCRMTGPGRAGMVGHHVTADHLLVTEVPANEGFFVRACGGRQVWVRLTGRGESPLHIRRHDHVTVAGLVRRVERDDVAADLSVSDAAEIRRMGVLLAIPFADVRVVHTS